MCKFSLVLQEQSRSEAGSGGVTPGDTQAHQAERLQSRGQEPGSLVGLPLAG